MNGPERLLQGGRALALALALAAAVIAAVLSTGPSARADVAGGDPRQVVTGTVDQTTRVAAPRTWTTARMRAAVVNAAQHQGQRGRRRQRPPRWTRANPGASLANADLPGTRVVGRLFFTRADGLASGCSGTLVESANHSVVWTAGHCVHAGRGGRPHGDIAFVPGFRSPALGGPAPFGVWPAVRWGTTRAFARGGDARHIRRDVGAVVLGRDPQGRTLTDVLGAAQRIVFGRRVRRVAVLGYPAAPPFNGEALYECGPNATGHIRGFLGRGPLPLGVACEQTPGSSGGPWLAGSDPTTGIGTIVGVSSWKASLRPWMAAPMHDRVAQRLYRTLSAVPN